MKTSLLDAKAVSRKLVRLINKHDKIYVAVAWAAMTKPAEALIANKDKFASVLIGIDFAATDPDIIDKLKEVPNTYVAASRGGCFHPKIYYFETGKKAEAIVGSANLTPGGLGSNHEACIHLAGEAAEPLFRAIRRQLQDYSPLRREITIAVAESYGRQVRDRPAPPRPKRPVLPGEGKSWERTNSELATMTWAQFVKAARLDPYHDFRKRMRLLRRAQTLFAGAPSSAALSPAEWKAIAGVIGDGEKVDAGPNSLEWGWFGSMGGAGVFAKAVGRKNEELAQALDSIPRLGIVTGAQFEIFCTRFARAFRREQRKGRVATATRLLAMKRPDSFVCVNKGNKAGLADALAFAPTTLSLDNYWERVIEPIRMSPWYNEARPAKRNGELWDYRVAMLDAIYYEPT